MRGESRAYTGDPDEEVLHEDSNSLSVGNQMFESNDGGTACDVAVVDRDVESEFRRSGNFEPVSNGQTHRSLAAACTSGIV